MADMRRFGPADLLLLLIVLAAAAGARAGYLMQCADNGNRDGPLRVQEAPAPAPGQDRDELKTLIDNVKEDFAFVSSAPFASEPEVTAHVAPGYPYLLGLLAQQLPADQFAFTVRWVQVGLGSLTAVFYYLFARRAFRSLLAGTLAGLFAALHPFWVIEVANFSDATLASCALGFCLLLGSQAGEKGGALKSLLLGASLAGLALVRAAYLPFAFVLLIWFLLRSRTLRLGWLCALCAFLGFGTALAPWTIRNYQDFDEPVPVVTSTYLDLWVGNNPNATGGPATEKIWRGAPTADLKQIHKQPERYNALGRYVADEVKANPIPTVQRRVNAALYFLLGERWFADGQVAEVTGTSDTMPEWLKDSYQGVLTGVLAGMLFLGFLGWRWSYGWRWESVPAALAVMWVPIPYILGHAGALSGARLPLDGVLLCYAAFALCCAVPGVGGHLLAGAEAAKTEHGQ
jgi:4-amino-4-deoxy-L-arabinose transferase-like glycosyltransferase